MGHVTRLEVGSTATQDSGQSRLRVDQRISPDPGPAPGRETELQRIIDFLDHEATGPAVLAIVGPAGIGKTHLWRVGLRSAAADQVLRSRASLDETTMDAVVLTDLVSGVPRHAFAALPGPQRRALETAMLRRHPSPVEPHDRHAVGLALRQLLAMMAASGPVVIAVDDAHAMDGGTAAVLAFAMRRLEGSPVRVLLTAPDELDVEQLTASWDVPVMRVLGLQPLPVDAFTALVGAHRAEMLFPRRVSRLHRAVGGNPAVALAILERLDEGAGSSAGRLDRFPIPARLEDSLRGALIDLPPEVLEALQVASALSRPAVEAIAEVIGAKEAAVCVGRAVGDELLELHDHGLRFIDPLMPSFLYHQMPTRDRLHLHRRLAMALLDPAERALHEALGSRPPAMAVAAAAAQVAHDEQARGEHDTAAQLAIEAVRLTPDSEAGLLRQRVELAVRSLVAAGDFVHAATLLEHTAGRQLPAAVRAELLLLLARLRSHTDHAAAAVHLLRLALSGDIEPQLRCRLELELAGVFLHMGYLPEAEHELALAVENQGEATPTMIQLWVGLARGELSSDARPALPPVTVDPLLPAIAQPLYTHACIDLAAGRREPARLHLAALQRQLAMTGDDLAIGHVLCRLSELERIAGAAAAALHYADAACTVARRTGQRGVLPFALSRRALVLVRLGRLDEAKGAAHEGAAIAAATGARRAGWLSQWALGFAAISEGDHELAARLLVPVTRASYTAGFVEPAMLRWVPDTIEALATVGDLALATELLEPFDAASQRLERTWAIALAGRARALVLGSGRDRGQALDVVTRSLEVYKSVADPFELARTMLVAGLLHRRQRRETEAGRLLHGALELFEGLDAQIWAARLRQELTAVPALADQPLTPVELRVAELAATGLSNRQIAAQLFISPKTVESHLSSVYRKLGIRSRAGLAHQLDAGGSSSPVSG